MSQTHLATRMTLPCIIINLKIKSSYVPHPHPLSDLGYTSGTINSSAMEISERQHLKVNTKCSIDKTQSHCSNSEAVKEDV